MSAAALKGRERRFQFFKISRRGTVKAMLFAGPGVGETQNARMQRLPFKPLRDGDRFVGGVIARPDARKARACAIDRVAEQRMTD